ncbi:superoxide dismutase [Cu-Zn] domain protein [Burkholderia pseudomallei MSHR1000]|nr:superoxide dismutase [Cu-Zn] domain protein [Burkholderia pseudomallei MSHR1000]
MFKIRKIPRRPASGGVCGTASHGIMTTFPKVPFTGPAGARQSVSPGMRIA